MYRSARPESDFGAHWIQGDLIDASLPHQLIRDIRPDAIIHNAALSKPEECDDNPDLANEINIEATDRLATVSDQTSTRFIFLSTDMVFDGNHPPYTESSLPNPIHRYGITKVTAERRIANRSDKHAIVRSSVIFGPQGIFNSNFAMHLIDHWQLGEPTNVFVDQFRNHVSVKWLCQALYELTESAFSGILHLGGGESTSRAEFAHCLAKRLNYPDQLLTETSLVGKLLAPRPRDLTFDVQLARSVLKTSPLTLAQGIALEWAQIL